MSNAKQKAREESGKLPVSGREREKDRERRFAAAVTAACFPILFPRLFVPILRMLDPFHRLARCFSYRSASKSASLSPSGAPRFAPSGHDVRGFVRRIFTLVKIVRSRERQPFISPALKEPIADRVLWPRSITVIILEVLCTSQRSSRHHTKCRMIDQIQGDSLLIKQTSV